MCYRNVIQLGFIMNDVSISMFACGTAERAAIAASAWIGRGDSKAADKAAVEAMRDYLNHLPINGTVVIGEGERDKAPMLYIGEKVGKGGALMDIALDPLEGTDVCATGGANSLAVIGMTESGGSFLHAPDVYMEKIAVGISMPEGALDLDNSVAENIKNYSKVSGKAIADIMVCILLRDRHEAMIEEVRKVGAKVKLIGDGDVYAVMATSLPNCDIDMYMGIGGAPEGVLAASALRCIGGDLQGRLILDDAEKVERSKGMGILDIKRKYSATDLASGDVVFCATGVTDGDLLKGVSFSSCGRYVYCESLIMRSKSGSLRRVFVQHLLSEI